MWSSDATGSSRPPSCPGVTSSRPADFNAQFVEWLGKANARVVRTIKSRPVVAGAILLDVRPVPSFAAAHPAGALSIPLRPAFASWLGWLAPPERPIIVVREPGQDLDEVLWQAAKIGYENIVGEVAGGIDAWTAASLPTTSTPITEATAQRGMRVLDIRQDAEYQAGHVPGALHVELGDLPGTVDRLADVPTVVMCGHGERAMGAASLLTGHGLTQVRVLAGSPEDWAEANGQQLETGP